MGWLHFSKGPDLMYLSLPLVMRIGDDTGKEAWIGLAARL